MNIVVHIMKYNIIPWLHVLSTLKLWRDLDELSKNTSWLLSYVQHGKIDLARFHAALVLTMGFNYYTSGNIGMSGIVNEKFMHDFFEWLSKYDEYFYGWKNDANVAVIFSRHTLDYLDGGNWEGYVYHDAFKGVQMMLIESNIPFKVITENNIDNISNFDIVILPDFACMNENQAEEIRQYVTNGGKIVAINETSLYDQYGKKQDNFLLHDVFGVDYGDVKDNIIYENVYGNMWKCCSHAIWERRQEDALYPKF